MNQYWVYILTNWNDHVVYVGMTNHLSRRMMEHRREMIVGFTPKYHVHKLVYYENTTDVKAAEAF